MKTVTSYAETVAIVVAVAAAVHLLAGIDWPWAVVAGAAASVLLRALLHRRSSPKSG